MHLLPLDRRTIFSRNVFCGATSPFLPPAMVILPAARGLGASRRSFSGQQQAGRGARERSRLEAPHAPHGDPAGQGRRLPPAAALAPSSRLPPRGPPRTALARGSPRCSRLRVGGGSRRARARSAPYRARAPPTACWRASGALPQRLGSRTRRRAKAGRAAPPSGHGRETCSESVLGWMERIEEQLS